MSRIPYYSCLFNWKKAMVLGTQERRYNGCNFCPFGALNQPSVRARASTLTLSSEL